MQNAGTLKAAVQGEARPPSSRFRRLEHILKIISRIIALAAVAGMLAISILTIVDVSLRALINTPIPGFYELVELMMAVIIASCFPAVLATRSSLTVDFLGEKLPPATRQFLVTLGSGLLLAFLVVLTWRFAIYAEGVASRSAETTTLLLPVAPFWWVVTTICGFGVLVQLVVTLSRLHVLALLVAGRAKAASSGNRVWNVVTAGLLLLAAVTVAIVLSAEPGSNRGWLVACTFIAMLCLIMLQVPLAAAMGLVGLASVAGVTGDYSAGLFKLATDARGSAGQA